MYSESDKESARERAARLWHNRRVMRETNQPEDEPSQPLNQSKLRYEILSIFKAKDQNIVMQYLIAINVRRKKLLKEKLRRLRMEQSDG